MKSMDDRINEVVSSKKEKGKFINFSNPEQELIYEIDYELGEAFQSMLSLELEDGNDTEAAKQARGNYEKLKAQAEKLNKFFGYMVVNIPD